MKEKLTLETIFKKEPTRSILNLLIEFQDKKEGLKQMHFRYALEKRYATSTQIKDDPEVNCNIIRMKDFFGDRLDYLVQNNRIKKECINNRQQLDYYLKQLGEKNLHMITKIGNGKKRARYQLRKDIYYEGIRIQNKEAFDFFSRDRIMSFPVKSSYRKNIVYGLSKRLFDTFNDTKKNIIKENIEEIEKRVKEIEEMKFKKLEEEWIDRIDKFCNETNNDKITKAFKENYWQFLALFDQAILNFCRSGPETSQMATKEEYIFYTLGIAKKSFRGFIPKQLSDEFKRLQKEEEGKYSKATIHKFTKVWSELFFRKDYGFTLTEIKKIVEWAWKYAKDEYESHPFGIAFSSYGTYSDWNS